MSTWGDIARARIAEVHASLPETATLAVRRAALRSAYPFGVRRFWPYRAWCKAQRAYLASYTASGQAVPERHLSPLERLMRKGGAP